MFGDPTLIRQRLGQGTFRVLVTDTYERRCAITRERTLPTLEAAHILPVGEGGRHRVDNGLLFRSDVHRLFDAGYLDGWRGSYAEHHRRGRERARPRARAGLADRLLARRAKVWGNVKESRLALHERGATHVEVTEYGTGPAWFAWERSRYDWSEADRIRQTVLDSNVLEPGSTWELRVRPRVVRRR